ncbi:tRNA glutamyl-Q(34) synthetase GluQRS [Kiloniella sp. b19]|uniref:tRNA glutamyl-Q(34) synthetase GluQRS n=1 Tax=Kiloniella sp. GXU_MW_B19 TaxID=3141326 RepID=UPI0031DE6EF7
MPIFRFAPSPSGLLHLGHAHSALFSWSEAQKAGGRFLLRIEDIDTTRCKPEFTEILMEDLHWLGLEWETPVRVQSRHMKAYRDALDKLDAMGLIYPCFCTRKEIQKEIAEAGRAPHGPDGPLYPGLCRNLTEQEQKERIEKGQIPALRLNMNKALQAAKAEKSPLVWQDKRAGEQKATPELLGDVVLARKDIGTSYHLSVVVDDAIQGITEITRGEDLFHATHLHRLLQALLELPVPVWHHHSLIADEKGQRLAKRNNALAISTLRDWGHSARDVRAMAGFPDPI